MWNIMRAQFYQLVRRTFVYFLVLAFLIFAGIMTFCLYLTDMEALPTGSQFWIDSGITMVLYSVMFFMVGIVSQVMCSDFEDKTICCDILSGHSRAQVYFGRATVAILVASVGTLLLSMVYPLVFTLMNGWGTALKLESVGILCLLLLFIFIRIASELVLVNVLIRNINISYLVGFTLSFIQMFVVFLHEGNHRFATGLSNAVYVLGVGYSEGSMTEGIDLVTYEMTITREMVVGTIGVSLFASVLCLFAGYCYFRKKDIG